MPPFYHLLIKSSRRRKDYIYIYCNMGQPKRRGNTLLPLQGVKSPVILGYPGCRFACPGLSARWAFSPLYLMTPLYLILHVKLDTLNNSPIR